MWKKTDVMDICCRTSEPKHYNFFNFAPLFDTLPASFVLRWSIWADNVKFGKKSL